MTRTFTGVVVVVLLTAGLVGCGKEPTKLPTNLKQDLPPPPVGSDGKQAGQRGGQGAGNPKAPSSSPD